MRIIQTLFFLVILFSFPYSSHAQTSNDSLKNKYITKQKAIRIANVRGFYKTAGKWNAIARLDTTKNSWEITSLKRKSWWPFKYLQSFKGDEKVRRRYMVIDAETGKILERKRKKHYITYFFY
jgi:hypothetical protein